MPTSTPTLTPTAYIIESARLDCQVKGNYNQKLNELFEAIASNKPTGETRRILNKMLHLAESIVVK